LFVAFDAKRSTTTTKQFKRDSCWKAASISIHQHQHPVCERGTSRMRYDSHEATSRSATTSRCVSSVAGSTSAGAQTLNAGMTPAVHVIVRH
jgi:hypothetical protein